MNRLIRLAVGALLVSVGLPALGQHRLAADLAPGPRSSSPRSLTAYDGALYFAAATDRRSLGTTGGGTYHLWRYTPSSGAERVSDLRLATHADNLFPMAVYDGALYFGADLPGTNDRELWRYTPQAGAELVAEVTPGTDATGSHIRELTVYDGALYFVAGIELYRYVGTGDPEEVDPDATIVWTVRAFDGLYMRSQRDGVLRHWRYTPDGGIEPAFTDGMGGHLEEAALYDGALYFPRMTSPSDTSRQLWRSGAGGEAPALVVDVPLDPSDRGWAHWLGLTEYAGALFFSGITQGVRAPSQLWRYTAAAGADPVGAPGIFGYEDPTVYDDALYYPGLAGSVGVELWRYRIGSEPELAANVHQGASDSSPSELTVVGDTLYFAAFESGTGRELYAYTPAPRATASEPPRAGGLDVRVWPNPSRGAVRVRLGDGWVGPVQVVVVDVLGRTVATVQEGPAAGPGAVEVSLDLAPGTYVVRASGAGVVETRSVTVVR